jgi:hypothetical protein
MGDFGLYAALSGTDNWAQKRQDKMSNLMMLERMEQRSEQRLTAQMQAEAGIQEQLDLMSQFDVLPEDQKDIEEAEQRARLNIVKGITRFNGDLKKYMASGGITDIGEYRRGVLNSSEMRNAVHNKAQYAQYIDAKQKDMFVGTAEIAVPVFDSSGSPQMKDGEIVREVKKLTMDQQLALRKRGLLDRLQVGMIEQKGRINPDYFKKNYKDARKPWSKDNIVTEMDVREALKLQGISDEQTNQLAKEYGQGLTPENALKWNAMNAYELNMMKARLEASKRAGGGGSDKRKIINNLRTRADRVMQHPSEMTATVGKYGVARELGAMEIITNSEAKTIESTIKRMGMKGYDQHYGKIPMEERQEEGYGTELGMYDLSMAKNINIEGLVGKIDPITGESKPFFKAKVFYSNNDLPDDEFMTSGLGVNNFTEVERVVDTYRDDDELKEVREEGMEGYVYIDAFPLTHDKGYAASLAKQEGLHTDINYAPTGVTHQTEAQHMSDLNARQMQREVDAAIELGYSRDDAVRAVRQRYGF